MITIQNVTKRYGSIAALDNISFTVNKGEILGFLGPNGAGKSTTMNIITGYISMNEGSVTVNDCDILENPNGVKSQIGYLPEFPPLYYDMTVRGYLEFVYDLKKVSADRREHLKEIAETVKIYGVYDRIIGNLSKGYKQRVGLAAALVGNPPVLILDEPTVGLDPLQIIEIRNLIKSLSENHTVILSSHILSEVQAICDRVIVINKGRIVADDTPDNLSEKLSQDRKFIIRVEGPERDVLELLQSISGVKEVLCQGQRESTAYEFSLEAFEGIDVRREVFRRLSEKQWAILGLRSTGMSLEDIFLQLTGSNDDEYENAPPTVAEGIENIDEPAGVSESAEATGSEETPKSAETEGGCDSDGNN